MSSFQFPPNLLHSSTEPQWLPRPRGETGSRYDALIREQEAHNERIRRQALPSPPPDAIGITANPDDAKSQQQGKVPDAASVDVLGVPPRTSFWDQHRQQVWDLTRAQRLTPPDEEVTRSAASMPSVRGNVRMILRSGREYRTG